MITSEDDNESCEATIQIRGTTFRLAAAFPGDAIIEIIHRTGDFYEADVLTKISERLRLKGISGAAIDAGAYIGNHTLYFAVVLGLKPILCFEANPESFDLLRSNLDRNGIGTLAFAKNVALGSTNGFCNIELGSVRNRGTSRLSSGSGGKIRLTLLDN